MYKVIIRRTRVWAKATRRFFLMASLLGVLGLVLFQTEVALAYSFAEFPVPTANSGPFDITAGPDGNLWFVEFTANKIGKITPAGIITEYVVPTANSGPISITAGPDGNLWFSEHSIDRIGKITPAGVITEYGTGLTAGGLPYGITAGPDGNLWFVEGLGDRIGKITPAGVITEYGTGLTANSFPTGITAGPDGNLWFTENNGDHIGKITTAGVITEYLVPTAISNLIGITAGPDGNLWFTENFTNKIGKITTAGVITEYVIPTANSVPNFITAGPDGSLWFTEQIGNKIGRITTAGAFTEYLIPTAGSNPYGITTGPDGNLWFTEYTGNQIGRLNPNSALALSLSFTPSAIQINGTSSLTFNLNNPNASALTALSFSDNLPANLVVAAGGITANTCTGSTVGGATSSSTSLSFSMPTLAGSSSCSFTVQVTSATNGSYTNIVTSISSTQTGSQPSNASATLVVGAANNSRANPADVVAQLRVTPDRVATSDLSNEISYSLFIKNMGPGKATNVSLRFPIDPNLVAGYTNFSDSRMWVSAIVTNVTQPYLEINLPSLEAGSQPLNATLVFRPSANATSGAVIFTRYMVSWADDTSGARSQLSNGVRFSLGNMNQDVSKGAIQLFDPPTTTAVSGSTFTLTGDFYEPNELVSLWYTDKNGISVGLGSQRADGDGKLVFTFSLKDFKAGEIYVIAGFGNRSEVTGSIVLTMF